MNRRLRTMERLPPMELAIMHILWDRGPSTVQDVQARLQGDPAYTTVQTILNTMARKGRTKRTLKGKAYVYQAILSRDAAMRSAVRDLIERTFQGSVDGLLMSLVNDEKIDKETIQRLNQLLETGGAE